MQLSPRAFALLALLLTAGLALPLRAQAAVTFAPPLSLPKGRAANLTAADFDADGKTDFAVIGDAASGTGYSASFFYGRGDGTFDPPIEIPLQEGQQWPYFVTIDMNADGRLDLVITQPGLDKILILLNRGGRSFASATSHSSPGYPCGVTVADFNEDGKLDMATANGSRGAIGVLLNRGDGTFLAPVYYGGGSNPSRITHNDFNGDGHADLAMANYVSGNVNVYLGDGKGRFTSSGNYAVGAYPATILTDDFNGDGKADLATPNAWSSSVSILLGDGTGRFQPAVPYAGEGLPHFGASADLDGDGDPDLAIPNGGTNGFSLYENAGNGTFLASVRIPAGGSNTRTLAVGDFNGDGRPDLVIGNEDTHNVTIHLNTSPRPVPAILSLALAPTLLSGGCQSAAAVVTLTAPAPAGGSTLTLTSTSPLLTVPATVTVPAGQTSVSFAAGTAPVLNTHPGTLTVAYNGSARRATFLIRPIGVATLMLAAGTIRGGQPVNGQVTLECPAPAGGLVVTLSSSLITAVPPLSLPIPAGASSAPFTLYPEFVTVPQDVILTASAGGQSRPATLTVLPDPPTAPPANLVATALSPAQIRLTWTDASSNEASFEIERKSGTTSFSRVATVAANTATFTDSGLTFNTTYVYRVRAVNGSAGSAYSNEAAATTPPDLPAVPTQLTATGIATSQITLAWRDNSGNETAFEIERKSGGAPFLRIGAVGANVTSYVDTGLDPGSSHRYRVRAVNASGVSAYSSEATTTTLVPPVPAPVMRRIAVFRPATREWFLREADGRATLASFGGPDDLPVPADYLGAGSAQIAVFRPATREWFLRTVGGFTIPVSFPVLGETPVPADYLGLGRAQIALYRAAAGEWYLRHDDGRASLTPFGAPGDLPVPADYFGLSRAQIAVFRPATGQWFLRTAEGGAVILPWGAPGDVPVPGDYLGLGRAQIAVYRPATAEFFLRDDLGRATRILLGAPGDTPVPGDFFGNGRTQLAVFRPGSGEWLVRADNGAVTRVLWGGAGDVPVPADFAAGFALVQAAGGR